MRLRWLGHAAFVVGLEDGTRILTDPYEAGFRGIIQYGPIRESAHIVTVSHEHGDHNHVASLPGSPEVVRGAGTHRVRGIEFLGVASFHDKAGGAERGPNTIFCFEADGVRICHLGDLGHPLGRDQLSMLGDVDVLLVPTGGPMATLELDEARELCRKIGPKIIIPMHFKTEKCSFPPHGVEDFIEGAANAERMKASEIELDRDRLPDRTRILVLEHAL